VLLTRQDLLTLPEHLKSLPAFSGVRVAQSCVVFLYYCLSFYPHSLHFLSFVDIRLQITPSVSQTFCNLHDKEYFLHVPSLFGHIYMHHIHSKY